MDCFSVEIGCVICILDIIAQKVCLLPMSATTHYIQRKQIEVWGLLGKCCAVYCSVRVGTVILEYFEHILTARVRHHNYK